jgi:IS30 family transposase
MAHHHFTAAERTEISILKKKNYSNRAIAREFGVSHTSIGRELQRNSTRKGYNSRSAKVKAYVRRKQSKYQGMKVQQRPELRNYIIDKLELFWTPEEIAGRLKEVDTHLPYVSAKGIYKWLYSAWGQGYCHLLTKKRYRPKKRREKKTRREMIPNRIGIEKRSEEANSRREYGHHETDTMVSGKKTGSKAAVTFLHDRKARFTKMKKIPNLRPETNAQALIAMGMTVECASISHDNGIENKNHETVAEALSTQTFFCDPYSSWQKGSVENTIGRVRRFIPKGADITNYSDEDIAAIEHWLNHTPRKCLNYRTPYEIMMENNLLLSSTHPET